MLRRLSVENYALIDKLDIEFASGLNIITGETGAGKSILLGALSLILGSRSDSAVAKDPGRNCVVEGEFDIAGYGLEPLFEEADIDYEPVTIIRRVISTSGKSRAYVNDIPVQLTALREIGGKLIDIHSQHQTLLLGDSRFQIKSVDSVADDGNLLDDYAKVYSELKIQERELARLKELAASASKDVEYVTYQLKQLHSMNLADGEQEELETYLKELTHASEIKENLLYSADVLGGDDERSILTLLKNMELSIGRLQNVFPVAGEYAQRLRSVLLELKDLYSEMASNGDRIEADNDRLESVRERLDAIYSLQQKHKVSSVAELLELQHKYEEQLKCINGYDEEIERLTVLIGELQEKAVKLASQITDVRKIAAEKVERYVVEVLSKLGMPSSQLKVEVIPSVGLQPDGADVVRFMFTANKNMPLQPIEKVASGGEMSRLMLALKSLLAGHSKLPTIIFDEIDTGVSGSIADKMGEIICTLAGDIQVINITHLPQVASKGDTHFFVYKEDTSAGTVTMIRKLDTDERIEEIAKMLSGSNVTDAARTQAKLLLGIH